MTRHAESVAMIPMLSELMMKLRFDSLSIYNSYTCFFLHYNLCIHSQKLHFIDCHINNYTALSVEILDDVRNSTTYSDFSL